MGRILGCALAVIVVSVTSAAEAQVCPAGYHWNAASGRCQQHHRRMCQPPYRHHPVSGQCLLPRGGCEQGSYLDVQTNTCKPRCAWDQYFDAGKGMCYPRCKPGHRYHAATNQCSAPRAGCPRGYYLEEGTNTCRPRCNEGYTYDRHANLCQPRCAAGQIWTGSECVFEQRSYRHHQHHRHHGYERPVVVQPVAMAPAPYAQLVASVNAQSFSSGKTSVISTAASANYFTCAQVAGLLRVLSFSNDRTSALRVLSPRIVDRSNAHLIYGALTFSSEKEEAARILGAPAAGG